MINRLICEMIHYESGCTKRIQHFTKVYAYAKLIGQAEGLCESEQRILEAAAVVHDIGIKPSLEKYGDSLGKHQEELGPARAEKMLLELGFDKSIVERVSFLVSRHHTYSGISGNDWQILVEADFLVNLYEDAESREAVLAAYNKIFVTETGKRICREMFGLEFCAEASDAV